MKKSDWLIAIVLMGLGILCMTISATSFLERPSASFLRTLLTICLWVGLPLFILGSGYYVIRSKLNRKSRYHRTKK